jgi:diacylglycerol kinase (ATP)
MTAPLLVVVNPVSGRGKGVQRARNFLELTTKYGIPAEIISCKGKVAMLAEVDSALSKKDYQGIVAIGGDGLVHTLLPILKSSRKPFTVLPAGTGNDFARQLGTYKRSDELTIQSIKRGSLMSIDLMQIHDGTNQVSACQVLSLGFDALVNERANGFTRIKGKFKYVFAMALELPVFRGQNFTITVDGTEFHREAMLIAVANGASYGGGMLIVPHASNSDGFLDVLILNKVTIFELIKVFPKVYSGRHINHPAIESLRGKEIKVSAEAKAYADGEYVGSLPLDIIVDHGALQAWKI